MHRRDNAEFAIYIVDGSRSSRVKVHCQSQVHRWFPIWPPLCPTLCVSPFL